MWISVQANLRNVTPDDLRFVLVEATGRILPEVGPVEGWLRHLGVKAHKSDWIPEVFQAMGPVHTGLKPAPNDVWEFIRRIGRYLEAQAPATSPTDHGASRHRL